MKGRVVVLDHLQGHEAAALMVDGRLHDFLIAGPGPGPLPGTIYRARAEKPLKGGGGAFVQTPDGRGFLRQAIRMKRLLESLCVIWFRWFG